MAAQENTNIQKLLNAEKKAQEIVGKARNERAEKMKSAKSEAVTEIAIFKKDVQKEYEAQAATSSSATGSTFQKLDDETKASIDAINNNLPKRKKEAVTLLVDHVTNVDLKA